MSSEIVRNLSLIQELHTAIRLIKAGLGQLQRLDGANDFYHLPILTLSSGFERLMKVLLCLRSQEESGEYPRFCDICPKKTNGHDLVYLLSEIKERCFLEKYKNEIPAAKKDFEYLESRDLLKFLTILSDFGKSARYYYLNVVLNKKNDTEAPDKEWGKLETDILMNNPEWRDEFFDSPSSDQVYAKIANVIVGRLERFARALARLFTIGGISSEAKAHTGMIKDFLFLQDAMLGTTTYSPFG